MGCFPDSASNLIGVKDEKCGEEGSEGQDGMKDQRGVMSGSEREREKKAIKKAFSCLLALLASQMLKLSKAAVFWEVHQTFIC